MMGTKVMTVTTQTATTKWVMNGMTTGERGAQKMWRLRYVRVIMLLMIMSYILHE